MAEPIPVICNRVADVPIPHIDRCSKVPCWKCGSACWISPATLASMAARDWRAECVPCASRRGHQSLIPMPPTAGQLAEVARALEGGAGNG